MPDVYVEEFLYRGRPPGDDREPSWHLILGAASTDGFGESRVDTRVLNVAQAGAAGWGLPEIIAAINDEALAEVEAKRAEKVVLEETISNEKSLRSKAEFACEAAVQERDAAVSALLAANARIEALEADKAALEDSLAAGD